MCGRRSNWRWRLLAALLLLSSVSSLAAAPESVTIPRETWDEITMRVKLLGAQLDALTQSEKLLQEKLTEERQASATALSRRDERIASLNDSLTKSTRALQAQTHLLIAESVALGTLVLGAVAYFIWAR